MNEKIQDEKIKNSIRHMFKYFGEVFASEEEMYTFYLKFLKKCEKPEDAYYELLTLSEYYIAMKQAKSPFLKLIMQISLIEKLNSKMSYLTFVDWLVKIEKDETFNKQKTIQRFHSNYEKKGSHNNRFKQFLKTIRKVHTIYSDDYGLGTKFRTFFQEYLTKQEKIELLKSIRCYNKSDNGSKSNLVPMFCFEENVCRLAPYYSCPMVNYNRKDCPICINEKSLKKSLNEFADFLYSLRSKFVHNAIMFDLASSQSATHPNGVTMTMSLVMYVNKHRFRDRKRQKYTGNILLDLTAKNLETILNSYFKRLLNEYLE